eukprot:gene1158-620_t
MTSDANTRNEEPVAPSTPKKSEQQKNATEEPKTPEKIVPSNIDVPQNGEEWLEEIVWAARTGEASDVCALLEKIPDGVKPGDAFENNSTSIMMASGNGHLKCLELILAADKSNILWKNEGNNTALHWAALNGHLDCVKALVNSGADALARNEFDRRPFDESFRKKHNEICEFLAPLSDLQEEEEFN